MEITELQKDLAATFRWTARLNMHEGVANHFSACVPGSSTDFYVNKAGLHFSQIKASDIILVTKDNIEELKKKPDLVDPTAINIHGAIHQKVPHARCIFHVHSKYATALSTLKDPIMKPIDQNTMIFFNRVSVFNEFGGLGVEDESIKMANALGNKQHLLLANHGIITTGETIAEGFNYLYYFEKAAETYLTALSTNKELNIVSDEIAEKTAQETADYPINLAQLHLDQIKKILDDNKATNITTIDLKDKSSIADYMVVASGTSSRHIQAVSEILLQQLKQSGLKHCTIEGKESDDWKLIDAIEVVVHIFHPEKRSLYNLEKMWENVLPKQNINA